MKSTSPYLFRHWFSVLLPILFLSTATAALAHPGHGPATGLHQGFAHPFTGWDHLVAMLAVGFWAFQLGAPRRICAAFVALMAAGGVAGHLAGTVTGVDQGIAASVLVLGLLIARRAALPLAPAAALVGLFALFHGFAHGAEMPATAGGLAYGSGFLAATIVILGAGAGLGALASRGSARWAQVAGWTVAAAGAVLLVR